MRALGLRTGAALLLTSALLLCAAPAAGDATDEVERIAQLAADHPDDAPLLWAYAHALADVGRYREADAQLARYETLRPQHAARATRRRGRWLYEAKAYDEARPMLVRALAADPSSGAAHLYLGLTLARIGAPQPAAAQFALAGTLEPELEADATLLGGLALLESGHEREAMALLRRVIDLDPDADLAHYAGLVLGERGTRGDRIRAELYTGFDYDTNVPLLSRDDLGGLPGNRDDGRATWGALLSARVYDGERASATLGARYDGSAHFDLTRYDSQTGTAFGGLGWSFGERVRARLDASFSYATLGGDPYAIYGSVVPSLFVGFGERGVLRLSASVEPIDYDERPIIDALERDGIAYGAALEHGAADEVLGGDQFEAVVLPLLLVRDGCEDLPGRSSRGERSVSSSMALEATSRFCSRLSV